MRLTLTTTEYNGEVKVLFDKEIEDPQPRKHCIHCGTQVVERSGKWEHLEGTGRWEACRLKAEPR